MPNDDRVPVYLDDGNSYTVETHTGGSESCVVLIVTTDELWLSPDETRELVRALRVAYERATAERIGGAFEARVAASRARLMPFAEDWEAPGMEAYDAEPEESDAR